MGDERVRSCCPFRTGHYCNVMCGLYNPAIKGCEIIGINSNLGMILKELKGGVKNERAKEKDPGRNKRV